MKNFFDSDFFSSLELFKENFKKKRWKSLRTKSIAIYLMKRTLLWKEKHFEWVQRLIIFTKSILNPPKFNNNLKVHYNSRIVIFKLMTFAKRRWFELSETRLHNQKFLVGRLIYNFFMSKTKIKQFSFIYFLIIKTKIISHCFFNALKCFSTKTFRNQLSHFSSRLWL